MTLDQKLGLLGLLGIAVLILIYILKPNYQQKIISSTFVWKLSLKYRRRRVPIDRFRNILIFICQVLIISLCAFMLAQPIIPAAEEPIINQKIAIIDPSASMLAKDPQRPRFYQKEGDTRYDDGSRFILAVEKARELGYEMLSSGGQITVILAEEEPRVIVANPSSVEEFDEKLDELVTITQRKPEGCSYGNANIEAAIKTTETIVAQNPNSEVFLLTATDYIITDRVEVISVASDTEWNMAILDCTAQIVENHFLFKVTVASYGAAPDLIVSITVIGANEEKETLTAEYEIPLQYIIDGKEIDIYFGPETKYDEDGNLLTEDFSAYYEHYVGIDVFSFTDFRANIYDFNGAVDSFDLDNSFALYGGTKEVIRIQYASAAPNPFVEAALGALRSTSKNQWDIDVVILPEGQSPEIEGFDLYVFEHKMPQTLPTDGAIIMMNPDRIPANLDLGVTLGQTVTLNKNDDNIPLIADFPSPILNGVNPSNITLFSYTKIGTQLGFETILTLDEEGDPALIVRNDIDVKVAIFPFSIHYSTLPIVVDWPILFANLFNYFIPATITKNAFEIGEEVEIRARAETVELSGGGLAEAEELKEFPAYITVDTPGTYTLTQSKMSGDIVTEKFYVRIPKIQSNFNLVIDELPEIIYPDMEFDDDKQLLIYFAMALVALLFLEWLLQTRSQF